MEESNTPDNQLNDVPVAAVQSRKRNISIVWIVPVVAALIGAWLVYKAFSEKGPTITITFESAAGLEAEKTKIKYKDVDVGQVVAINISPDLKNVVVTAELTKEAKPFLTEKARFWVVRARVGAGEISGLGTLFSGAYIGMDPGLSGKSQRHFNGLEIPPIVTSGQPGKHFELRASQLGSLDVGSLVFYRQIQVGRVVEYKLQKDGQAVSIKIFIRAPYDRLVKKSTRFWNASGLDVSVSAEGIKVDTESFVTMMAGGIAFDTPIDVESNGSAQEGEVFKLYKNREQIFEKTYVHKRTWLLFFDGSVRGLTEGAPVEFRGIRIGQVKDVTLEYITEEKAMRIPVLIETERERVKIIGSLPSESENEEVMDYFVAQGLRAQLKMGNIVTGQLLVDMDFHPDAPPAKIIREGRYPQLPTIPTPVAEITARLSDILKKVDQFPIEQIGKDLGGAIKGVNRLVNSKDLNQAVAKLNQTIQETQLLMKNLNSNLAPELQKTVADVSGVVNPDSPLIRELNRLLTEMAEAAKSIRLMTDYLERHPEALIYGKGNKP